VTQRQLVGLFVVGVAAVAALLVAYGFLPIEASWRVNRILHHVWQAASGLGAAGGVVWAFWPRPKAPRRDLARQAAHRRLAAIVGMIVVGAALIVTAEVWRDRVSRRFLGPAQDDLARISAALAAYGRDHEGNRPARIEDLMPTYLEHMYLYYVHRRGPYPTEPPADAATEPPSYVVRKSRPSAEPEGGPRRRQEIAVVAYLEPGNAWAPLTITLREDGRIHIVGEDVVAGFEAERHVP